MQPSDLDDIERSMPGLSRQACVASMERAKEVLASNPQMPSTIRQRWLNVIASAEQRLAVLHERAKRRQRPSTS